MKHSLPFYFIIFDVTYCNIIYFLFLTLPDVDQKCRDMEVSLGLSEGKLADTWSSLSGGEKGREWEGRVERIKEFLHRNVVRNMDG